MLKISSQKMNRIIGVVAVAACIPALVWLTLAPLSERIASPFATLTSISQLSALLGTVLFATFLILRLFSKTKSESRLIGTLSLLFLLTHPIVAMIKMTTFASASAVTFFDWSISLGIYAFLLLLSLGAITFFANQQNEKLRALPLALNSILFLGTFHAFLLPSSLSESLIIKTYILALTGFVGVVYVVKFAYNKLPKATTTSEEKA